MTTLNVDVDYLTMSHELRIPLTEILGMAELLNAEKLSATQIEEVAIIKQAGNRLLSMIDKILTSQEEEIQNQIQIAH